MLHWSRLLVYLAATYGDFMFTVAWAKLHLLHKDVCAALIAYACGTCASQGALVAYVHYDANDVGL